jgi:perosamine synthetase
LAENYFRRLSRVPLEFHRERPGTVHAYWMVSAAARDKEERDRLRQHLVSAGVETRPVFHPVHMMGIYPHALGGKTIAEDIAGRGLNLPSWPDMSESEFEIVSRAIERFFSGG